jgi:hypothetical protein
MRFRLLATTSTPEVQRQLKKSAQDTELRRIYIWRTTGAHDVLVLMRTDIDSITPQYSSLKRRYRNVEVCIRHPNRRKYHYSIDEVRKYWNVSTLNHYNKAASKRFRFSSDS